MNTAKSKHITFDIKTLRENAELLKNEVEADELEGLKNGKISPKELGGARRQTNKSVIHKWSTECWAKIEAKLRKIQNGQFPLGVKREIKTTKEKLRNPNRTIKTNTQRARQCELRKHALKIAGWGK